jgi:hypothetical protein
MSPLLLGLVAVAYIYTGWEEMSKSYWWLGFWASYASANIFYILATRSMSAVH